MRKLYLIVFLSLFLPLLSAAQMNVANKPSKQPADLNPSSVKNQAAPSQTTQTAQAKAAPLYKQASKSKAPGRNKPKVIHKKKITSGTIYGNEWINYSQKYYKIKVAHNGIYRIDSATLAKAGIPVASISGAYYQIFFRGQQQYIYVQSKTGILTDVNGDYIEFYGQYNDGALDSLLYYDIKFLPNPYYSLFNDSSTYYLTWSTQPGLRMTMQTDTAWNNYGPVAPYVMTSTTNIENQYYFAGAQTVVGSYLPNDPRFTQNASWVPSPYGYWAYGTTNVAYPVNVKSTLVYTGANAPSVFMRTVLLGLNTGNSPFTVSTSARQIWNSDTCKGFQAFDTTFTFASTDLFNYSNFSVTFYNNATSSTTYAIAPSYIYLSYPHLLNLGGDSTFTMQVPDNTSGPTKSYLQFTNFYTNNSSDNVWFYDLTNHNRFQVKPEFGGFNVIVPNGGLKQCYLTSDAIIDSAKFSVNKVSLIPVGKGRNGYFTNFTSEDSNAYIIISHPTLWQGAEAYASYRKSRGFDTVVADINELYDQFGYGVDYSPLGIRRFCNYAIDKWLGPPAYLFLIGKGIHTPLIRPDTANWRRRQFFVPSFGNPSSDILLTSQLDSLGPLEPSIPTGRLAAQSNEDVTNYLAKMKIYESTPAALWMKNVAHFAGGNSWMEEQPFYYILQNYANVITQPLFGAKVYTFQKTSPNPINGSLTDSIKNLVDTGVSIMTFFGHAGGSDWDESIDYPSDFSNNGKYPFMIADACFSGDIFQPIGQAISSVSEDWVLSGSYPGAIGFLASDYLGNPPQLNTYTQALYDNFTYDPYYRKPIGLNIQNVIEQSQYSMSPFMIYTNLEMTLHGDPALAINEQDSFPDYAVTNQSIYFTPTNVTVLQDSFVVNVVVSNYAEAVNQLVPGVLTRTFPNGRSVHYPLPFKNVYYQATASIKIPVNESPDTLGAGLNYFSAYVDLYPEDDTELTYTNNSTASPGVPLWITSEDITPVWPYDYAIISKDTATLKASTNDPFAPNRTYYFEIDTSHSFNSPLFKSVAITNSGGVIMATPFDNWGTTHYKGPVRNEVVKNSKEITGKEADANKANIASNKSASTEKISAGKNNITLSLSGQQAQVAGNKQIPLQSNSIQPIKGIKGQKGSIEMEKIHRVSHGPIRDSFINNAVYYWRVRRDTADTTDYPWVNTSFQYIKGKYGWGQSNFYQYDNDELYNDNYNFINFNQPPRGWDFNTLGHTLECFTFGMLLSHINTTEQYATEYKIDDFVYANNGCTNNWGIYVAVINPVTISPWVTSQYDFGNANNQLNSSANTCIYTDNKFVFWDNSPAQMDSLVKMLKYIPNGYYILVWSWEEGAYKAPDLANAPAVISELESLGASQMGLHATVPGMDSVPFIFFVQKGNPASVQQVYGRNSSDSLQLSANLSSNGSYGCITTPLIGPVYRYDSISWNQHPDDRPPLTDSTRLNILGVEPNGTVKTLIADITPAIANMYITSINPVLFPYIQLLMYTKDVINHTPGQMNYWRVFYQPVPEIAMNPNVYTYYHADTLQYGDNLNFQTTVQNISDWAIDSTQLLIWTTDAYNNVKYYNPKRYVKPLNPGDTAKVSFILNNAVQGTSTLKSVWMEVNPEDYPSTRLEQYHFNDYASKNFYSYGDKINPVLDVTFNGIHILNNDIVSPTPQILITFMDENKFLALNNPNDFKVYIRNINTTGTPQLIAYGPQLTFTPAVLPHNKCNLLYTPTLADGTYELTVQGTDISGNLSANNSYKIDFQVINKSMISEVLNYPNPFTTSTRFVFILTGDQIPTTFKIQVMTVTGKIIREITEDEIGPIHIGRNITQYAWDGTDKFGSKLANGVYLYRVVTSINGQSIDDYQTGADQYFTKGWGKMYLMR
jgi:hypothetical protein